jgi:pimeloyl-ACP methyl ester carboxylesterase
VVRAVVVVHGAGRNPGYYFEMMVLAASWAGFRNGTLIISPHFQTRGDGPGSGEATWTTNGWKRGDESDPLVPSGGTVSSYGAVDRVLRLLGDSLRFPKLETVVVTGHSAGGQYTHRFAATSPVEEEISHLRFRYIVANPSTYLYIGPERRSARGEGFEVPDRSACPTYNRWHYGFEDRNPYALRLSEEGIRARLLGRDVIYLVGTADVGTAALDMSCGAMLQGERRYPRGLNLFAFLNTFFPGHPHQLFEIPGVAHSSQGMYTSPKGGEVLFRW